MPPKGWRKYPDGFKPVNSSGTPVREKEVYSIEELLLPRSSVLRLAKNVLPGDALLPKDGVTALLRSSTVFISYLAAAANKVAHDANRKAVKPQDVFKALEDINFATFIIPVREDLERYEGYRNSRKNRILEGSGEAPAGVATEDGIPEEDLISDDEEKDVLSNYSNSTTSAQAIAKRLRLSEPPTEGASSPDTSSATIAQEDPNEISGNETVGNETIGNETAGNDTNATIAQEDPNETLDEPTGDASAHFEETAEPISIRMDDKEATEGAEEDPKTDLHSESEDEDEETASFRQK